jgi:hypothetical protein
VESQLIDDMRFSLRPMPKTAKVDPATAAKLSSKRQPAPAQGEKAAAAVIAAAGRGVRARFSRRAKDAILPGGDARPRASYERHGDMVFSYGRMARIRSKCAAATRSTVNRATGRKWIEDARGVRLCWPALA